MEELELKLELIERIHKLEIELKDKMQKDKNELMRWYFAYWISLVVLSSPIIFY